MLLSAALRSIFALDGLDRAVVDVIVVDNSDTGSARSVVALLSVGAPVGVTYTVAHPANISIARNIGVAATTADIVAFLDDDQEAESGWLAAVIDGCGRFSHDVFFGPIEPRFETDASATPAARAMFTRASTRAAGDAVSAFGRGRQDFPLSTANCIFRRLRSLNEPAPFDARFGQCGGEDLHLFFRLERAGRSFGWLPEARASEFIPTRRCDPRYLIARHYAGGQAFAACQIWTSPIPVRARGVVLLKALLQLVVFPLVAAKKALRGGAGATIAMRFAGICGKLFWGQLYPLYRREDRR